MGKLAGCKAHHQPFCLQKTFLLTHNNGGGKLQGWWGTFWEGRRLAKSFFTSLPAAKGVFCNVHHGSHFSDTPFDLLTPLKSC